MAEEILNPLLALIKEQSLIDDLQYEEVVAEHKRAGTQVIQILQDFGIMDLDTILFSFILLSNAPLEKRHSSARWT